MQVRRAPTGLDDRGSALRHCQDRSTRWRNCSMSRSSPLFWRRRASRHDLPPLSSGPTTMASWDAAWRPLPFSPESIKRLAPAADPELSSLAVSRAEDGLSLWGLLDVPRLLCLQIFGLDTGQLRVTYHGQPQMVHTHGRGRVRREHDPSFITSIQLIAAAMGLVTPQWYRPRALLGLADALIQTGHGGAILVSKRPAEEIRRNRIGLTYPSFGPLRTLEEPVLEAEEAAPAASPDSEVLAHFKSVERQRDIYRSARLGSVDGAVLVDPHLRIMGFGAMIDVKGMKGSGRVFLVDLPSGMPHLSEAPANLSRVSALSKSRWNRSAASVTNRRCAGARHPQPRSLHSSAPRTGLRVSSRP